MIAANLILLGLAVGFLVVAGIGLRGAWPMMLAGFLTLAAWVVVAVWAVVNLLQLFSGDDADDAIRSMVAYVMVAAPVTGLGLAFLAFVKCGPVVVPRALHALGLTTLVAGVVVVALDWEDASLLAKVLAVAVPPLWGLAWLIPYLLLRGSVDEAAYAAAPTVLLPFPGGERTWVIQGNGSALNHNTAHFTQAFAWDFRRPCGTPVLAALGGRVVSVIDANDGIGGPNNEVEVEHADGSVASYLHVQKGSAQVAVGATVAQGDRLASVGSVGNSLTGHIHFQVRSGGSTVPVRFADVTRHAGIPRGFRFYTSGNR
ncbi:hypothetical protein PROP_03317 [Propionicimonas sp. T2.31MG-18]|uniref:M23 family metallopeptidase n=1 Tax=Propionicimonas sp. T2.31MG-18 TaxID=3157620 RepID=UPI0035EAB386